MNFHYNAAARKKIRPSMTSQDNTPAWAAVCLISELTEWLGQPHSLSHCYSNNQLRLRYDTLSFPVFEFGELAGGLLWQLNRQWPVQIFGMADNNELVELSFVESEDAMLMEQRNISGKWHEDLQELYLSMELPDAKSCGCMAELLQAVAQRRCVIAMGWEYADFLTEQKLCQMDNTLSFCYVPLDANFARRDPVACLEGLSAGQKSMLWRMFLEKRLYPPEFEWLRSALNGGELSDRVEWHLSLYQTFEELAIRFVCRDSCFELFDREGERIYFDIHHNKAPEQVLMKILFPLNQ